MKEKVRREESEVIDKWVQCQRFKLSLALRVASTLRGTQYLSSHASMKGNLYLRTSQQNFKKISFWDFPVANYWSRRPSPTSSTVWSLNYKSTTPGSLIVIDIMSCMANLALLSCGRGGCSLVHSNFTCNNAVPVYPIQKWVQRVAILSMPF